MHAPQSVDLVLSHPMVHRVAGQDVRAQSTVPTRLGRLTVRGPRD